LQDSSNSSSALTLVGADAVPLTLINRGDCSSLSPSLLCISGSGGPGVERRTSNVESSAADPELRLRLASSPLSYNHLTRSDSGQSHHLLSMTAAQLLPSLLPISAASAPVDGALVREAPPVQAAVSIRAQRSCAAWHSFFAMM
jgi:hypothetical protein